MSLETPFISEFSNSKSSLFKLEDLEIRSILEISTIFSSAESSKGTEQIMTLMPFDDFKCPICVYVIEYVEE